MAEIEDITDVEFDKRLEQVQLGECDVVDSLMDKQWDLLE